MYVISRVFKCEKRHHSLYKDFFFKPSPLNQFKGFVKKELMMNNHQNHDIVRLSVFFESKKSFYQWEGSPEHIALHKDKHSSHHQKLDGVIDMTVEKYDYLGKVSYANE